MHGPTWTVLANLTPFSPQRIREKYATRGAALYREKLDAAADGRPWSEPLPER